MHVFPRLLGWVQVSQAQSVSGKTEGMMDGCAGGGEVASQITGVQKPKKEKAKILLVDGADTSWGGQYKIRGLRQKMYKKTLPVDTALENKQLHRYA
jgi:hypothetical protein